MTLANKKIKFFWNKNNEPLDSDTVLINLKTVAFVLCSVISAFINFAFISNLTKEGYEIGTLFIVPAAILLGLLSIGLDIVKCLHAIQVNTLNELYRKLSNYAWAKKIKSVSRKWFTVYLLYVILSIITSVSLSSISIGSGITRNANLIQRIDDCIKEGESYTIINKGTDTIKLESMISKVADNSETEAREYANKVVAEVEEFIDEIAPIVNAEYVDTEDSTAEQKKKEALKPYERKRNKINEILHNAGYRKRTFDELATFNTLNLTNDIKQKRLEYLRSNSNDNAVKNLGELEDGNNAKIYGWLENLNSLEFVNPKNNKIVEFKTTDSPANVLAEGAIQKLKALRTDVENDSGDIGSSSKIFMQIGSFFESKKTESKGIKDALNVKRTSSFGSTEVMMMGMLLFLSLLCELAINQFAPKTKISRKLLNQFSQYFPKNFDVNDFMIDVYIDQYNYGVMTKEQFDESVKQAIIMKSVTKKKLLEEFDKSKVIIPDENKVTVPTKIIEEIKKAPIKKTPAKKVVSAKDVANKTTKEPVKKNLNVKPEEVEIEAKPNVEIMPEQTANKLIVKSAEFELNEMLKGKS